MQTIQSNGFTLQILPGPDGNSLFRKIVIPCCFRRIFMLCMGILGCFQGVAQHRWLAIKHATVLDMKGPEPKRNQTVLIEDGRIVAIGPARKVRVPEQAHVINSRGRFLMPGLWDSHVHLSKAGANSLPLFIANGITGVRDMGGDPAVVLSWRKQIDEGQLMGPRIKTPGPILETDDNVARMKREGTVEPIERTRVGIGSDDAAIRIVDSISRLRIDFLKVRTVASKSIYQTIVREAEKKGLTITGHAVVGLEEMLQAGQRSIEHAFLPPLAHTVNTAERTSLFHRMAKQKW